MNGGFAYRSPYRLTPGIPSPGPATFLRHPIAYLLQPGSYAAIAPLARRLSKTTFGYLAQLIQHWARIHGYGNINPLSIDYACRPRLRSRLTLGGLTWPRNPWSFGGRVSHSSFATHACILTPVASTASSHCCFHGHRTLPYPSQHLAPTTTVETGYCWNAAASAVYLSPATLSAQDHLTSELLRTLSRVAASKPTSWLSKRPHILFHLVHA